MAFEPAVDLTGFLLGELSDRNCVSDSNSVFTDGVEIDGNTIDVEFSDSNCVSDGNAVFTQGHDLGDNMLDVEFAEHRVTDGDPIFTQSAIEYVSALPTVPGDTGQVIVFGFTMDFKGDPRRINLGDIVEFEPFVYGPPIISYLWRFGDGETSNKINPKHQYKKSGWYTVTLTCVDETGQQVTVKKRLYIFVNDYGLDFIGTPRSGPAQLKVKFEVVFKPL